MEEPIGWLPTGYENQMERSTLNFLSMHHVNFRRILFICRPSPPLARVYLKSPSPTSGTERVRAQNFPLLGVRLKIEAREGEGTPRIPLFIFPSRTNTLAKSVSKLSARVVALKSQSQQHKHVLESF